MVHLGGVRFWNQVEWNGTVPHPEPILVFFSEMEWNGTVPEKGIFPQYAESTGSADSAGRVERNSNPGRLTLI